MEYQEFRELYEKLYGGKALFFLNTNNAKTENGTLVTDDILQRCCQEIGSPIYEPLGNWGDTWTPEFAARIAHKKLCGEVKKTFLRQLSREKAMVLQAIMYIGQDAEFIINDCVSLNDHTLVYEWNKVHPDQHSLTIGSNIAPLVASSLSELRVIAGLTQKELATASGVDIRQIQKLESGEAAIENARTITVVKMAKALGVEATDLLRIGEKQKKGKK